MIERYRLKNIKHSSHNVISNEWLNLSKQSQSIFAHLSLSLTSPSLLNARLSGQITEFALPFAVGDLAPPSDGYLWFVGDSVIGRITPTGVVIAKFPMATNKITALTAGPDGNLWFLEDDGYVGRITPAEEVRRFPAFEPMIPAFPVIIAGTDGNLWFSAGAGKIGRITKSGAVTLFPLPPRAQVGALAAGADGRIWFIRSDTSYTDMSGNFWWTQIGCITP